MVIMKKKYNCEVLVISDLHLGDLSGSDDFTYAGFKKIKEAEKKLIEYIKKVNPRKIILLGDIFEIEQHEIDSIYRAYRNLFKFFKEEIEEYIIVEGNHDNLNLYTEALTIILPNEQEVFLSHGHQGDNSMSSPWTSFGIKLLGWVEKIFPGIDQLALSVYSLVPKHKRPIYAKTRAYAKKCLKLYDYVVCGHTHICDITLNGRYYNTGTCQGGRFSGVIINENTLSTVTAVDGELLYNSLGEVY